MWPSDRTFILLIAGVIPLGILLSRVRRGWRDVVSLKFVGVLTVWVGFHLSPWIVLSSGQYWRNFLLVEAYVDRGLLFSTLWMMSFLIGYRSSGSTRVMCVKKRNGFALPSISVGVLVTLAAFSGLSAVWSAGGFDRLLASEFPRGYGQFEERDWAGRVSQMVGVVTNAANLITMAVASCFVARRWPAAPSALLGTFCLLLSSLQLVWGFSRLAGGGFALTAIMLVVRLRRRGLLAAVAYGVLGLYLCAVGWLGRGLTNPGVWNFATVAAKPSRFLSGSAVEKFDVSVYNLLDSVPTWTRLAAFRDDDQPEWLSMLPEVLLALQPLPSELVGGGRVGPSLSKRMGTWGGTGITSPALGELYYVFGECAVVFGLLLGRACSWFDREWRRRQDILGLAGVVLCSAGLVIGNIAGVRAMTRPMVYTFTIWVLTRQGSGLLDLREGRGLQNRHLAGISGS